VPESEYRANLREVLQRQQWIVEGWSYQSSLRERLAASDTIIYLEYPIWFCYWSALQRHIRYTCKQNPYDPPNSPIWRKTRKMVRAMWYVYRHYEPELRQLLPEYADGRFLYRFTSRRKLRRWMRDHGYSAPTT
jgi:adenylate kinase family enzyme